MYKIMIGPKIFLFLQSMLILTVKELRMKAVFIFTYQFLYVIDVGHGGHLPPKFVFI